MANLRRRLTGKVVSDKMDKTVLVEVVSTKIHPLYQKVIRSTKRYMVHDEKNAAKIGDGVQIVEARPMSKRKRWALETILKKPNAAKAIEN